MFGGKTEKEIDLVSKTMLEGNTKMEIDLESKAINESAAILNQTVETINTIENLPLDVTKLNIKYSTFKDEDEMTQIKKLIEAELSEPYSIYTYRYFIYNWPKLCILAKHEKRVVGVIVCKQSVHNCVERGYIGMLAVHNDYRKQKIGTKLVGKAIDTMIAAKADEVVLETEITNIAALRLYESMGFVRDKRLFRYYLNGNEAFRLKLWLH